MKTLIPFLIFFGIEAIAPAIAQSRPKIKARRAFVHNSEASRGKNSKARFRRNSKPPVIDLTPGKLEKFKTAKANKPYKFPNPH
ncbi:hypothetical protein [Hymenobacter terrenus]|uniref:hypothetical protein n=1 Tax=Hymenobacter terrenus TaxID=1629124 RepID=UPI000619A4F2|nr:hypothetical protein [Hymenobacter terrenus]